MSGLVHDWMARHQGKHHCRCGCGAPIIVKRHHHNRGIPQFKKGHMNKGSGNGKWNGGVVKEFHGYRLIHMPSHPQAQKPNGYVFEHRLVAQRILGRHLRADEEVHHINGSRDDNHPKNLAVLSRREHRRLHNGREVRITSLAELLK